MEKLTDFQVENLIESMIQKNKKTKEKQLTEFYIKKWNNCKTKKDRFEFFNEFFSRRKKLINEGYDVSLDEGILSSLFSGGLGGLKSTFKEWIVKKILGGLGIQDEGLKAKIAMGFANLNWTQDWTKFLSPIKNCSYFADVVADSIMEYYASKLTSKVFGTGVFGDTLRNAISDSLTDEKHVQAIQDAISGVLCSVLQKIFGGGSIMDTVKSAMGGGSKPSGSPEPSL